MKELFAKLKSRFVAVVLVLVVAFYAIREILFYFKEAENAKDKARLEAEDEKLIKETATADANAAHRVQSYEELRRRYIESQTPDVSGSNTGGGSGTGRPEDTGGITGS